MLRRNLLLGCGALVCSCACVRAAERPAAPTPRAAPPPEFGAWRREAQAMLTDALDTLRTFDIFMAYRVATPASTSRTANDLDWDAPTSAAWNEATHVAQGLSGRADQLFQSVSTARVDGDLWREQRQAAEAAHMLLDVGAALAAYRGQLDTLAPGDASSVSGLLDQAWARWTECAARWGLSRSEPIGCGS